MLKVLSRVLSLLQRTWLLCTTSVSTLGSGPVARSQQPLQGAASLVCPWDVPQDLQQLNETGNSLSPSLQSPSSAIYSQGSGKLRFAARQALGTHGPGHGAWCLSTGGAGGWEMSILKGNGAQLKAFAGTRCQSSVCNGRRVKSVLHASRCGKGCIYPLIYACCGSKVGSSSAPCPVTQHPSHISAHTHAHQNLCLLKPFANCSCSLPRTGISAAQGPKKEIQDYSAMGLSPLFHQDVQNLYTVTGCCALRREPGHISHSPVLREAGSPRQVGFLHGEPAGSDCCRGSLPTL